MNALTGLHGPGIAILGSILFAGFLFGFLFGRYVERERVKWLFRVAVKYRSGTVTARTERAAETLRALGFTAEEAVKGLRDYSKVGIQAPLAPFPIKPKPGYRLSDRSSVRKRPDFVPKPQRGNRALPVITFPEKENG